MSTLFLEYALSQPYDCLILAHPQIQVLEKISNEIQKQGIACLNISKDLSTALMPISSYERSLFIQKWLIDTLFLFKTTPVLCIIPDLLFDPSLEIDPLALFRQAARIIRLIVLWPGEYSISNLSYAIPEHNHFRTWKISDSMIQQPVVVIHQISASQGV